MAKAFNLTAELNLRGPSNLKQIVGEIRRELGTVTADVKLQVDPKAATAIDAITKKLTSMNNVLSTSVANTNRLNTELKQLGASLGSIGNSGTKVTGSIRSVSEASTAASKATKDASTSMEEFGRQGFLAVKRFAAFSIAAGSIATLTRAVTSGLKAFISFDREIIRLRQVTGEGALGIKDLENEITRLSVNLGISSESLIQTASTLAQAGLTAKETKIALETLAKTELAPSFDNIADTTEGAIAAIRQFSLETTELESALGSINAVAAAFAVESGDIIAAIQRTGGVFASASRGVSEGTDALNEFIAVFTSVRATTRESAETIATGLRTIFTRIQRADTIKQLRGFGIELQDLEGKFVGPFEAIRRLSEGLANLDPRDIRFSSIVEELGGFRQIGKVIPLIQQFETAQKALGVAQRGQGSLTDAQIVAQQSLANQLARVREQFLALIRDIGQSKAFNTLFTIVTNLASGLISLAGAFKPILPLLGIIGAVKGVKALTEFGGGFFGQLSKAGARKTGSNIGGAISGTREKERAETVSRANDLIKMNTDALNTLTQSINMLTARIRSGGSSTLKDGGRIYRFNKGGVVPGSGKGDKVRAMLEPGEVVMSNDAVNTYGRANLARMNRYADGGITIQDLKGPGKRGFGKKTIKSYQKSNTNIEDDDYINTGGSVIQRQTIDKILTLRDFETFIPDTSDKDTLARKQKSYDAKIGSVAERLLQTRLNAKKYSGLGTSTSNISNAPIDLVSEDSSSIIYEVKFKNESTTDAEIYSKLLRYKLEKNSTSILSQFKENNPDPEVKDPISLGSITLIEAGNLRSQLDATYRPKKAGGKIQKFPVGGMVGRVPMKKSIDDDRASAVYDNTRNKEVKGSVYAPRIGPDLYAVDTAGVSKPGQGYGVPLYDAVLQQVSAKKAWLTSSRTQVSEQARSIWDGYRKKRPDVKNKLLPMEQWNMDPLFNGQIEGEPLNDLAYQFPENLNDLKKHKKTWPQKDHPVWSLQHAYQLKAKAIKKFMAGGKVQRNLGYIDYDVIANEANAGVVEAGMKKAGVTGPRLYAEYLTDLAVKARKSKQLDKLRAIYGVAGSGKTTLARGQGTDIGRLRETTRFPILTPEDIERANEILVLTSSVSRDKLEGFLSEVDRAYTLSSTTEAEKERIKAQRASRDTTGIGLEGRTPGTTTGAAKSTAVGEALLGDALGERSVVLGRTQSGRLRRKSGDELVEIIKKRIGFTWGGFAPTTRGHESIVDSAAAYGISPEDFIALVGADEGVKPGDASSYRTAILDQDARILLARAGFGAKGATVLPKSRDFEVPQGFDVSEQGQRSKVVLPASGSMAFVADKGEDQLAKYRAAGYDVANLPRSEGISGSMVRDLIAAGDMAKLQEVLSPGVYDMISSNVGRLQNRASVLPTIIAEVEKTQASSLANLDQQIKAVGISRIDRKRVETDPEYAAKAKVLEELRAQRDKIKKAGAFEPYRLLAKLAASKPDQYGLDFSTKPTAPSLGSIPSFATPTTPAPQQSSVTKAKTAAVTKAQATTAKVGTKKVRKQLASMKMPGSALISEVGGIGPAVSLLQKNGFDLGRGDQAQSARTMLRSNQAAKQVLIDAINAEYAEFMGGISQQGLAFGAVGLAGNPYTDQVRVLEDRLKAPVQVNISGRLANDKFKELMQSQIDTGYESTIMGGAQRLTIAQILEDIVGGNKLISDFDKVINYGADIIPSDPGAPMFSEFSDLNKVRDALASSSLSPFGQSLVDLVKSAGPQGASSSELLNRMFINTARSQATAPLIKEWLDSVGLPIPLQNIYGVGGANVSGSSIPKLKAAIVQKLGGGSFVDDDSANVAGVAETMRSSGLSGKSYLMPYGQSQGSEANTAKGVLFQNILQELGAFRNTDRQSIDFPKGLGSQAAGLFNDGGMFVTLPTDAKYTLSGANDMVSNITNYLRAQGYMAGGAVKAPQRSFGTGNFPFPKRITNAYFKELDKMTSFEEFDTSAGFSLKDTTVRVDELGMREAYDSSPLDLERFKRSFKEKLSRNTLISGMSDFAKVVGLPSESFMDYLPQVVDFDQPSSTISTAYFDLNPSLNRKAYNLENFGWSEAQEQDLYGIQALIKEKEKEIKRIIKKPVKTFDDGSFSYDYEAARKADEELRVLKDRLFNLKDAKLTAEKAARANAKSVAETTGRGTIGFNTKLSMFGRGAPGSSLYHELGHQLLSTFKTRVPESFEKYKARVVSLFDGDNDDVAQAIDALPGANYKSADIAYGRSYKMGALSAKQSYLIREQKPEYKDLIARASDIRSAADAITTAKIFKTLNPVVNSTLQMLGMEEPRINKLEDMGKEEFLTTLLQNYPILDSNLNGVLQSTLDELFSAGGVERQRFAEGGVIDKPKFSTKAEWIEAFKRQDKTNNTSSFDKDGNLLPHINDWVEEELKNKKQKTFGKVGLRSSASEITATYFKNQDREGFVTAKKSSGNLFTIGLSKATKGYGPRLYDIVMEAATAQGGMLTSDRNQVSDAARAVWGFYFNSRKDVKKTPLDPSQWTKNQQYIDPKLYGKPETWPPANDPAWILQSGYSKNPELINSPDVIDLNDPKYAKFIQMQQASFLSRNMGGPIGRFSGGGVAAMVSNGEGFVPPTVAKKIGYAKLDRINQADRNGMRGFSGGGGISVFKGPGSGTSDSIGPISLPTGGYVIRKGAMDALGFSNGGTVQKFKTGGKATEKIKQKKIEIDTEQEKLEVLKKRSKTATGSEKILIDRQISETENTIVQLNSEVNILTNQLGKFRQTIDKATRSQNTQQKQLDTANQKLLDVIRNKVTVGGKSFDELGESEQVSVMDDIRSGKYKGKSKTIDKALEDVDYSEKALATTTRKRRKTQNKKQQSFGDLESTKDVTEATMTPIEIKNRKASDNAFFEYRAQTEGTNVRGVKLGIAKELGRAQFEASGAQFEGRKAEASNKLFLQQDTLKNLAQTRAKAQSVLSPRSKASAEERQSATVELASINQRLAAETDNIVQQMIELNPTLGDSEEKMKELRASAETVAESLGSGDLAAAQKAFTDAIGSAPEGPDALRVAMLNTAKKLGISVDLLEREFGEAGDSAKEVARQSFVQSREGQRFGALAQFAPDMLSRFSESRGGRVLGAGADFISGKGGRFSQAFANVGGIAGVGAGATLIADQLQQGLKNYAPALSSDVNVAGAVGALGGAGTGAASGAVLGAQIAGPVGALVAGIGGAVIGGIQGFFSAKNQQILINALEKIASTTGELDIALKNLAQTANDVNFKNAQKAFGDVIQASGDIRSLALGSSTLTAGDAGGIAVSAGAGAIGGAVAGAIAGSVVPVIGTAVGAAIGGAIGGIAGGSYGFFNRPSAAQRQEALGALVNQAGKQQDIASRFAERDLGKLNVDQLMKLYDELNAGTSEFNPIAQQYVDSMLAAAAATQQAKTGSDVLTAAQKQEITTTALNTAALDSYMKARKEAGATDEQISKEINTNTAQAIKIGQYYNDENAKLLAKQVALAKATQVLANEFANLDDVFNRVGSFTDRFKAELEQLDVNIQTRVGDLTGKSEVQRSDRTFERVLSNISAYSPEEVSQAANFAATLGGGGEQAVALANTANLARVFQNQLPQLIRASADFAGDDLADVSGREGVVAELERQLTAAVERPDGTVAAGAQTAIKQIIDQARGELDSGKPVDASNFEKLSTTLNNGTQQLQKFVSTYYDLLDKAIQYQNQYNALISQSAEALRKANIVGVTAELDLAKVFDRDLSLDQLNAPFEAGIRDLTSALVAGGSTDPQEIAGAIQDKQAELVQKREQRQGIQAQIAAVGAGNPQNQNLAELQAQTEGLIVEERDLARAINDGSQALDQLASDGTKASNALSKIASQRERSKAVGDLTERLLTGSAADVQETQFRALGLRAALADPNQLKSRQTRQDAFGGLADLQGILKPEQFNKIRADLLEGSLKAQGVNLNDELISGTSWREVLADIRGQANEEDPQVKAYRDAIDAQKTAGEQIAESIRQAAEQLNIDKNKPVDFDEPVKGIDEFLNRLNTEYPTIVERAYAAVTADLENIKTTAEEARKRDAEAGVAPPPPERRAEPERIDTTKSEPYKSKVAGLFGAEVTGYGGAAVDAAGAAIVAGEVGRRIYGARVEAAKVGEVEAAQRKDRIKAETKRLRAEDPNLGKEEAKAKAAQTVDEQIKAEKAGKKSGKPAGSAPTPTAATQAADATTPKPATAPPRRSPGAKPIAPAQGPATTVAQTAATTPKPVTASPPRRSPGAKPIAPAQGPVSTAAITPKPATTPPRTTAPRAGGRPRFGGRVGRGAAGAAGLVALGVGVYAGYRYIADERKRLEEEKKYSEKALQDLSTEAQDLEIDTSTPQAQKQLADINAAAIQAGKSVSESPEFMAQAQSIQSDKTLTEEQKQKKLEELAAPVAQQEQRVRDIGLRSLQLQQGGAAGTPAEIQAQATTITDLMTEGKTQEAEDLFNKALGIQSDQASTTQSDSSSNSETSSTSTESQAAKIAAETLAMSEAVMNITNATLNIDNLSGVLPGSLFTGPQPTTPQSLTTQALSTAGFVPQPKVSASTPEPIDIFAGASDKAAAEAEAAKQQLEAEAQNLNRETAKGIIDTGASVASYSAASAGLTPLVGKAAALKGGGAALGVGLVRTGLEATGVPQALGERGSTGREIYETSADAATAGAILAGGPAGIAINTAADAIYTGAELIRDPSGKFTQWNQSTQQSDNINNAGLVMGSLQNAAGGLARPIDTLGQGLVQGGGALYDTGAMVMSALAAAQAEQRASTAISSSFAERGQAVGVDSSAVGELTTQAGLSAGIQAKDIGFIDAEIQILEDLLKKGFDLQQVSQLAQGTNIGIGSFDMGQLQSGFGIDTLEEYIGKRKQTRAGLLEGQGVSDSVKTELFTKASTQARDVYLAESNAEMDRLGLSRPQQQQTEATTQAVSQLMDTSSIFGSIDPNILLNIGAIIAQGFATTAQQLFAQTNNQTQGLEGPITGIAEQPANNSNVQAITALEDMATKATKPGSIYTHDTRAEALLQQLVNTNSSSTSTPDVAEPTNLNEAVIEANKQMLQARGKITEYNQGLQGAPEDIQAYQDAKAKLEGLQAMQAQRHQLALKSPTPPSTQAITTNDKKPSDQITQTAPTQQTPAVTESQARIAEQPVVDNPLGITRISEDADQSTPTITSKPMNRRQSMLAQRRANYLQNKESRRQAYLATLSPERRAKIAEAEKKKQDAELSRARKLEVKQGFGEKLTKPQQQLVDKYKPQIEMEARKIEETSNKAAEETQSNVANIGTDRIDFALGGGDIDQAIAIQQRADAARKEREEAGKARAQQVLANNAVPVSPTQGAPTTNFAASSAGGPSMQNLGAQPINTAFLNNVTAAETGVQQTQQTGGPDNSLIYSLSLDDKSTEILNSFNKTLSETLGGFGQNFENYISRLEGLTFTHKLDGEYNINVNFTGEAPLKALNDTMKQLAEDLVMPEIEKLRGEIKNAGMDLRTRGSPG